MIPQRIGDPRFDEPKDQQGFAYPVPVVFLLAPTIGLPFPVVQAGFRWLLVILTLASVLLWLRALRWRPSIAVTAILIVLTFGSYAVVQGIKLQQLSLLVSALLAGCAAALVAGYFSLAGFLLALATIKPQLALPLAGWLALWAVSGWRRRQTFLWSFALTTAIFLAASEYVLPGWMRQFRDAVAAYRQYTGGAGSLLDVLTTPLLGKIIAAAAVIAVVITGWKMRHASHDSVGLQHHAGAGSGRDSGDRAYLCALQSGASPARGISDRRLVEGFVEAEPAYPGRLRGGIAGCGLALGGILRTHAGFAFFASGCGSPSLGRTSLYQSWHSAGGFGIVKCVRQRSLAGLFGSRRAKTVETWSGL